MPASDLPLRHALVLGALHGPAELLPVSSSAHMTLVPFLLGWEGYAALDDDVRKAFEVAVHAGTAVGVLVAARPPRPSLAFLAGSLAPAAAAGLALEGPIERQLGRPFPIAVGLAAGGVLMVLADHRGTGRRRAPASGRPSTGDALALGAGQALALVPGLSRAGMTVAAARLRGFSRAEASVLSRQTALPVILGATALKARRGVPRGLRTRFAAAAAAACATTVASRSLAVGDRPLWPFAAYRVALAAAAIRRVRHTGSR